MTEAELLNAMKYGSKERADKASLGKFGLGKDRLDRHLHCDDSYIATKGGELSKRAWDLDYVTELNDWYMLEEPVTDDEAEKFEELAASDANHLEQVRSSSSKSYDEEPGNRKKGQPLNV